MISEIAKEEFVICFLRSLFVAGFSFCETSFGFVLLLQAFASFRFVSVSFLFSFSLLLLFFSDPDKQHLHYWFVLLLQASSFFSFFLSLSFSCSFRILASTGYFLPHRSFFLSFLMRSVVWNIRLLPQVGQSHRSLEILLFCSHPSSWTLIRNSLLLLLLLLCCALSRMLLLRTCLSIPIHTNAEAHEYNTFVPILSFFSQCLFLLCDDDSTSTRVVIHEFSFQ